MEKLIGVKLSDEQVVENLGKMGLETMRIKDSDSFNVSIPFYRTDILH